MAWSRGREEERQDRCYPDGHRLLGKDVCGGDGGGPMENGLVESGGASAEAAGDPRRAAESPLPLYSPSSSSFFCKS